MRFVGHHWDCRDGRFPPQVCHISRLEPELSATVSAALGRTVVRMVEMLMNSAYAASVPNRRNPAAHAAMTVPRKTVGAETEHDHQHDNEADTIIREKAAGFRRRPSHSVDNARRTLSSIRRATRDPLSALDGNT